jgi:UDP-GlcNAc:undecaprenyl-phosphate GlcNAc-1-phosphate transferase
VLICLLGTFDDYRPLPKSVRVAGQAAIAAGVWALGAGWETTLPQWADLLLTIVWVVAATNAFNLFDNLDGAATSVGAGSALGVVGIALFAGGSWPPAILAAGLLGACVAFLRFNLARPARIFLGDGGANLLGFVIAATAMTALGGRTSVTVYLAAALLIAVPLLDTAMVSISRSRRGTPILAGGRDHLTHRGQVHLGTARRVAAAVFAAQALICALSVICLQIGPAAVAAAAIAVAASAVAIVALEARFEFTDFSPTRLQSARRVS